MTRAHRAVTNGDTVLYDVSTIWKFVAIDDVMRIDASKRRISVLRHPLAATDDTGVTVTFEDRLAKMFPDTAFIHVTRMKLRDITTSNLPSWVNTIII